MESKPMTWHLNRARIEQSMVIQELLRGLRTDGAHHKQYYLEQALIRIVGTDEVLKMRQDGDWEEAIMP